MRRSLLLALIFVLLTTPVRADITTGLVGWWKFDEASGTTVADSSSTGLNGTFIGTPSIVPGVDGNARRFNGTDVVRLPWNAATALGVKTVALWVRHEDYHRLGETYFGFKGGDCSDSYRVGFPTNTASDRGAIKVSYENAAGSIMRPGAYAAPDGTLVLGKWDHYAIVYNASGADIAMSVYKNGSAIGTPVTASDGFSTGRCALEVIGSQEDVTNENYIRQFTGDMDDARLYNRALSTDDVAELYASYTIPGTGDVTAPTAPTDLTATKHSTASSSWVDLSWTASTDAVGVKGYLIYRATSEGGTYTLLASSNTTSYQDISRTLTSNTWVAALNIAASTTYWYKVRAYDLAYNQSALSTAASVTTDAAPEGTYTLTIIKSGADQGIVASSPSGITCGATCTATFNKESTVHIVADSAGDEWGEHKPFTGFVGATCTYAAVCVLHMDSDKTVTAYYTDSPPSELTPSLSGVSLHGCGVR